MERGLFELHEEPERADRLVWSRRRFIAGGVVATMERTLSAAIPYGRFLPAGMIPVAIAESQPGTLVAEKSGLRVLNDRPLNAETPAHLLDDEITPAELLFVRNNGVPPAAADPETWQLSVTGEACLAPRTFSLAELKREFRQYTYRLQLECGGNGRAEFRPRVPGNQWTTGAIGCPEWTGVRLKDVLERVGVRGDAAYVAYRSADTHLSGDGSKDVISRGVPLSKALEAESLLAFQMNGEPIPHIHGAPLRMVCGGWPGSVSGKWVTEVLLRDRLHDGAKMLGSSYRVPCRPVAPGESVSDEGMCIIQSMPVKSLITHPRSGSSAVVGRPMEVRGHAWAGDRSIAEVAVSVDFGATWQPAVLARPANRLAWQRWRATVKLPVPGYYEIWARAIDSAGVSQPMLVPGWNPKGYLNNAAHRIALRAG
jgi:DMSO/TMAO reductase YedYZ molybdopterin-dependent catalytic subunit